MGVAERLSWAARWPGAAIWVLAAVAAYGLAVVLPFARHASPACVPPPGRGPYKVLFGRFSSADAAQTFAARALAVGFKGLSVQQDSCSRWEVALYQIPSERVGHEIQAEARSARLTVTVEPVRAS